jgi:hypothetical protein
MIASVAVLPEPTITKARGIQVRLASSWSGATRTSSLAGNGAGVVAGMVGDRYVASTTRRQLHGRGLARDERRDEMGRAVRAVFATAEEGHAPGLEEALVEDAVVVRADLGDARTFLEARLRPGRLDRTGSEDGRRDAVEQGRLVQLDERVRVEPVPAGRVAAIDERDVHVCVIDERIGERHAHGSGADDEIVGFERSHHADLIQPISSASPMEP